MYKAIITTLAVTALSLTYTGVAAETVTFNCKYDNYSDQEGRHKLNKEFKMSFILDTQDGKAFITGNLGSEPVTPIIGDSTATFIEVTNTKNVMSTSITIDTGESVHSRHTVMVGQLYPSQYYGTCKIL
mgnify:CR=1 FL=1